MERDRRRERERDKAQPMQTGAVQAQHHVLAESRARDQICTTEQRSGSNNVITFVASPETVRTSSTHALSIQYACNLVILPFDALFTRRRKSAVE